MENEIEIVFIDIDWTLLNHSFKPAKYDIDSLNAIKEIQDKGVKVFICTAREYQTVEHTGLLDLIRPDGLILCNGGLIIYEGQVLYKNQIDNKYFYPLCKAALSMGLNIQASQIYTRFLIAPKNEEVEEFYGVYKDVIPPVMDYHEHHIITAILFAHEDEEAKLKEIVPKELKFYRFHNAGVDIVTSPNYKGDGVKFVLEYLKINKDHAMAIGDDNPDISMFDEVKYSIAMGNAKDEVKEKAYFISKDISESGVKYALDKFILKKED